LRDAFAAMDMPAFAMTTGSKGLHVVVPLDGSADFDAVKAFARDLAARLAQRHPDRLTTEQRKDKRGARIFLDILRNAYGQTAVAPYSLRARPGAPVATPIGWDELDAKLTPDRWTHETVLRRLAQKADPWAGMMQKAVAPDPKALARI
jgi:bifunctional non-homologous end joining protein LigD